MLTVETNSVKWQPLSDCALRLPALPGWVLRLTYNGSQTLGVWSNGRAVYTVLAAQA
jgi:hypothetical protein